MSLANTITLVINFVALVFLGVQVMQARKVASETARGQEREWDRQRKKSSIDAIVATAQYRESLKAVLPANDRDPKAVAAFLEEAKGDNAKLGPLGEYLNHIEDLAVGVKQGIFDLDAISMLEGNRLIDIIPNYVSYMESVREQAGRPTIWQDIDDLVEMIKAHKGLVVFSHESASSTPSTERGLLKLKLVGKRLWAIFHEGAPDERERIGR
jgi:hypothetical protein